MCVYIHCNFVGVVSDLVYRLFLADFGTFLLIVDEAVQSAEGRLAIESVHV